MSATLSALVVGTFISAPLLTLHGAEPFNSAVVTRVENTVKYGQEAGANSVQRPAVPDDVIKAFDYLLSEEKSRAELRYDDGSIVRIGQNTVFSFEPNARTLSLKKGVFVFFIPKHGGGGTIKTPSFTAAITGTIGMVAEQDMGVVEGTVRVHGNKTPPGGAVTKHVDTGFSKDPEDGFSKDSSGWAEVRAGQAVHFNADGTMTIGKFDSSAAWADASLLSFNGDITDLPGIGEGPATAFLGPPASSPNLVPPIANPTVVSNANPPTGNGTTPPPNADPGVPPDPPIVTP